MPPDVATRLRTIRLINARQTLVGAWVPYRRAGTAEIERRLILEGALCSLSLFLRQHLHDLFLLPGCGAIACRKKLARAEAERYKSPYMFTKHLPKFGVHWCGRFRTTASPFP